MKSTPVARRPPASFVADATNKPAEGGCKIAVGFDWAPFQSIPNVKKFSVKIGPEDPLFKDFGIKKKVAPEVEFSYYRNQRVIRYAVHSISRLRTTKNHALY